MKTIHQIAEAAYAAYAKSITRSGADPDRWDDLTPAQRTAWYEAMRQGLAEAAVTIKPECKVNGIVSPGHMCGKRLVGGGCGFDGECQHKEGSAA